VGRKRATSGQPTTVAQRIRLIASSHGLTIDEFAKRCDFLPPHVSRLVNSKNDPSFFSINAILHAFPEVNGRWLITGEDMK
jgi:transcriptional regulator with XRE-family HTH domain